MPNAVFSGGRSMSANAVPSLLQHVRRLAASSDEQLLADFLARRSDEAFAALLGRHGPMVLNVCRRILHDAHAAEDVFQATFLVLADRAAAIRRPASLAGFLHGVAYRLAVRARRRRVQSLPAAVRDKAAGPPEELAWKEVLGILDHELGQLSDRYRAPLVLCYLEGRTQDEAARQLGWSLNTLRRRLAQGRRLLEARLRGRGVTLPAVLAGLLAGGAVAVPGPLRAATLAAAGARAVGGLTAGASALSAAGKGIPLFSSAAGRKVGSAVAVAALAAAVGFGYVLTMPAHQPPAAEERSRIEDRGSRIGGAMRAPRAAGSAVSILDPRSSILDPQSSPVADPLPAQGAVRLGTARYRHGTRIESFAVSADGRLAVATRGWRLPSSARVFDLTDGRCLYSLPPEPGMAISSVGLSPDGKILATQDDQGVCLRDATTGKPFRTIGYLPAPGGYSMTDCLTFTPDGKQVVATLGGDAIHLIDVGTGKVTRAFAPVIPVFGCAFSPDGKLMATRGYGSRDEGNFAQLWEVATGKELQRIAVSHDVQQSIAALAFAPDGTTIAGARWRDARLRLWETATGKELKAFPKVGEDIVSVAFAPDGKSVAAAGDRIYLYDPVTGKERLRIERRARGLAFSRDGSVLTGAVSGAIYRWDAASGRQLTPAAAQDTAVEQILVSADGRQVFTTDQDGDLYLWDAAGRKSPRRIAGGVDRGVVASSDRRFLAWTVRGVYGNSRIRLYDVAAERVIDPVLRSSAGFKEIGGEATVAAFLPDGKSLLTLQGGPATFRLWDLASGRERRTFAVVPPKSVGDPGGRLSPMLPFCTPRRAALSPDGKTLAVGPDFPEGFRGVPVRLWDVATGKAGHELQEPLRLVGGPDEAGSGRAARSLWGARWHMKSRDGRAFSPDGRLLVDWAEHPFGRSRIDHVYVWDVATGRAVATLAAGPRNGAANAAFAPDGRTLATASADGVVRLWEVATWKVRAEFRGHRHRVTALAFGPDGRLFTGGLDTVVLGWDVRPPRGPDRGTVADAWAALADADAKAGFQAQGRFLAESGEAVKWFAARLSPAAVPDPSRVKALIADLNHANFATRARATAALKEHWPVTAAALRAVMAKASSDEARRRAEGIVREMEKGVAPPDVLRALRAAEVLEWIATKEARALLRELANGGPGARLTVEAAAACQRLEGRK
jgi:RNA polymerase sigma factor (sigma-70 family)